MATLAEFADRRAGRAGVDVIQLRETRARPLNTGWARSRPATNWRRWRYSPTRRRRHGALLARQRPAPTSPAAARRRRAAPGPARPAAERGRADIVGPDTVIGRSTHDPSAGRPQRSPRTSTISAPGGAVLADPDQARTHCARGLALVRGRRRSLACNKPWFAHRRHRRRSTAGGAGRRARGASSVRAGYSPGGGGSPSRGRAAQFGTCSSELIRELSCDGGLIWVGPRCTNTKTPLLDLDGCAAGCAAARRHGQAAGPPARVRRPLPTGRETGMQRPGRPPRSSTDPPHLGGSRDWPPSAAVQPPSATTVV